MEHYCVVGRTEFESVTNPLKGDCSTAELTTRTILNEKRVQRVGKSFSPEVSY